MPKTRYTVTHSPHSKVEALARQHGYTGAPGESYWDFIDTSECEEITVKRRYLDAHRLAKKLAKNDVFGGTILEQAEFTPDPDTPSEDCWNIIRRWDIEP